MPVGFSSAARNLFLLGSTGSVATNFFKQVDESSDPLGSWVPKSIIYNYTDQKYIIGGINKDSNTKDRGWISKRNYDAETDPENPSTTQDWEVTSAYGVPNGGSLRFNKLKIDASNKVIIAGDYNFGSGNKPFVARYSTTGVLEWQATSNYNGRATDITSDSNNNYYICGTNDEGESFAEKYDDNGSVLWSTLVSTGDGNDDTVLETIGVNSRGEVIAGGTLDATTPHRGYLVKLNALNGEVLWDKTFSRSYDPQGGNSLGYTAPVEILELFVDSQDQIYLAGRYGSPPRSWIAKLTAEGNIIWQKATDNTTNVMGGIAIIPLGIRSDGETEQTIVLSRAATSITNALYLSKYSKNGELVWRRQLYKGANGSSGNYLRSYGQSLDADASFYYVTYSDETLNYIGGTPEKYYFGKVSSSGNGLGAFNYDDGSPVELEYTISTQEDSYAERLRDGSIRNDVSDMMAYPFTANQVVFDDLATPVANKKRQVTENNSVDITTGRAITYTSLQELNLLGTVYSGSGDWLDQSGEGNNGEVYNASSLTNNGTYWSFDGTGGNRIEVPNLTSEEIGTTFTAEAWFYSTTFASIPNGASDAYPRRIMSTNRAAGSTKWCIGVSNAGRVGFGGAAGVEEGNSFTKPISLNRWYHVVVVHDSTSYSLYVDGELVATNNSSPIDSANALHLTVGGRPGETNRAFAGRIGEVRIYKRTLTVAQIEQNYNATKSKYINEAPETAPKVISDPILINTNLKLNYDFNNRATYDTAQNLLYPSREGASMLNDGGRTTTDIDYTIKDPWGGYGGVLKCEHPAQGTGYFRRGRNTPLTAGKPYTVSFYFKNGTISEPWEGRNTINGPSFSCATFNPTFEAPMQTLDKNTPVGNGWYKQIFTFTPQYSQTYQAGFNISHNQPPLGIWYLAGFQIEQSSFDRTYVETTTAAVTPSTSFVNNLANQTETGTMFGSAAFEGDHFSVGSGSWISPPGGNYLSTGTSDFTVETWVRANSFPVPWNALYYSQSSNANGFYGIGYGTSVGWFIGDYNGTDRRTASAGSTSYSTGTWYHFVAKRESNNLTVWINGSDVTGNTASTTMSYSANDPRIGVNPVVPTGEYWDGDVAEFRFYGVALSATEIAANFNATRSKYGV